jgi:molybdopterin molybdotransferase
MIEVSAAVKLINEAKLNLSTEKIPLEKVIGRVLRENLYADTDFPPFDRVMMDGIAIRSEDFGQGIREFAVEGIQAAGAPRMKIGSKASCLEVMTGAVAPQGTDVVVRYEDVEIDKVAGTAKVLIEDIEIGKNIHRQGTDKKRGELLISRNTCIGAPEIAVAASIGKTALEVTSLPSLAIVSTGDELVEIDQKPMPHQIRRSNVYALSGELAKFGISPHMHHITDDRKLIKEEINKILNGNQIVLLSGGISRGKFDFVPEVLDELGVTKVFHRVRQKPGKPFMFGVRQDKNAVFAFPGNPVSTFACFHKYFVPWLKRQLGMEAQSDLKAILNEDFSIKTGLTYYLQVRARIDAQGRVVADPMVGHGSGDHANLLVSNGFLELPSNSYTFKKGDVFDFIPFRNF